MSLLVLLGEKVAPATTGVVLPTWGQYSTYVDAQGRYRVIWQWDATGDILFHKFDTIKTTEELNTYFVQYLIDQEFGDIKKIQTRLDDNETLLVEVITQIRTHPALTYVQYTNYLNTKEWYEQVVIKAFLFKLALGLAEKYGLTLSNYTEIEILQKLRDWICSVNINVLKKVVFGYFINIE
jgi:hypothetical protein